MSSLESTRADSASAGSFGSGLVGPDLLALSSRRIRISAFEQQSLTHISALLMTMDGQSGAPVEIEIGGSGHDVDAALQVLDVLEAMRAPVSCTCSLLASGTAAAILSAHPGRRIINKRSSVVMRIVPDAAPTNLVAADLTTAANVASRSRSALAAAVARRTRQPVDWVLSQFDSGTMLDPAEAITLGLFDALAAEHPRDVKAGAPVTSHRAVGPAIESRPDLVE